MTLSQVLTHSRLRPDIRFPFGVDQIIHDGPIRECLIREYGDVYKCGRATEYTRGEYSGVGHARISKHVVNNQEVQRTAFEHTVASLLTSNGGYQSHNRSGYGSFAGI